MSDEAEPSIQITENGPYIVTGGLPLSEQSIGVDDANNSWTWKMGQAGTTTSRCAHSRASARASEGIWAGVPETDSDGTRQVVAYEAEHCPRPYGRWPVAG